MKKILAFLTLFCCLNMTGCSNSEEGVYVFKSMKITIAGVTKTYTCTTSEKSSNEIIKNACNSIGDGKLRVKLEEGKYYYYAVDKDGNALEGVEVYSTDYKIENGELLLKEEDEFMINGTYEDDTIVLTRGLMEGASLVFEKK